MPVDCQNLMIVDSRFGFLSLIFRASTVLHLSLGSATRARARCLAVAAQGDSLLRELSHPPTSTTRRFMTQLLRYTEGERQEFAEVRIETAGMSPFARRVTTACQQIPYGQTLTYGELARRADSPGAARAVGRVMAQNRVPLLVPCHRVVAAGNRLGGFSAGRGTQLKRQLLEMEATACGKQLALAQR